MTFDQAISKAFEQGKITDETAILYASNKGKMNRYLDDAKKRQGVASLDTSGLKLDSLSFAK
jgi:twitching motility protein PilT